jgi:hypothetical protein
MFQTQASLKKKSQNGNIDREEYISLLASEFYSTRIVDIQEQTSANLANLSYDPINYAFLKEHCVHDIFLELIGTVHTNLILHGIAGLCNFCLDDQFHQFIIENNGVQLITALLKHQDDQIKINAVACLLFLIRPATKSLICTSSTKATIEDLCLSSNECLSKLAAYFVTDQFMDYDASEPCPSVPQSFQFFSENGGNTTAADSSS